MTKPKPKAPEFSATNPITELMTIPDDRSFIRCKCGHAAYRDPAEPETWLCACRLGGGCHVPVEIPSPAGGTVMAYRPFRLRDAH